MVWWMWVVAGGALLVLEIVTPGFVLIFFGVAAVIVGLAAGIGLQLPLWGEILAFAVLSVVLLLAFRGPMLRWMGTRSRAVPRIDRLEDETAVALEDLAPGAVGRAELRGTPWAARNIDDAPLVAGTRCRVAKVDGLTLHLAREHRE